MGRELARTWRDAVRIWLVPKDRFLAKQWGWLQKGFWGAVCLALLIPILKLVIELVKLVK